MREIDPGLAAHLAARVTTLCHCWKLMLADGAVMGFTDHDRTITFDGVTYEPESGFDASEDTSATGFAVGGLEVIGALSSERLTAEDFAAGRYDGAAVRVFLVNWNAPEERHLMRAGTLGEVSRADGQFRAEIRGLAAALDQPNGRIFRPACDTDLGDTRCGIDLEEGDYRGTGTVESGDGRRRFSASGLGDFDAGWFERGRLVWLTGANAGRAIEVRAHRVRDEAAEMELWQPMVGAIEIGDTFRVTAGCDKRFQTCVAKFGNGINFRGFPHMPGNDFALSYARAGQGNDGEPVIE